MASVVIKHAKWCTDVHSNYRIPLPVLNGHFCFHKVDVSRHLTSGISGHCIVSHCSVLLSFLLHIKNQHTKHLHQHIPIYLFPCMYKEVRRGQDSWDFWVRPCKPPCRLEPRSSARLVTTEPSLLTHSYPFRLSALVSLCIHNFLPTLYQVLASDQLAHLSYSYLLNMCIQAYMCGGLWLPCGIWRLNSGPQACAQTSTSTCWAISWIPDAIKS